MGKRSQDGRLEMWRQMLANLHPDLDEFAHLERDFEALEGIHAEATALSAHLLVLRAQVRQATSRLRSLMRRGDMTRTRIGAGLRSSLGYDAKQLIRYGFHPRPKHRLDLASPLPDRSPQGSPDPSKVA